MQDEKRILEGLKALADVFTEETREQEQYKNMFKATDGESFHDLLRQVKYEMTGPALTAITAYKDKTGKQITNEQMDLLFALPYLVRKMTKTIEGEQGFICSVDKVYECLNRLFINKASK